jgi:hypothetical protein
MSHLDSTCNISERRIRFCYPIERAGPMNENRMINSREKQQSDTDNNCKNRGHDSPRFSSNESDLKETWLAEASLEALYVNFDGGQPDLAGFHGGFESIDNGLVKL